MSFRFLNEGQTGNIQQFTPIDTFIDPVSKIRVSNPSNLIDTDFEYGLQPTKWETVELINNTPAFFSKSGDTTISDITGITTNSGTREVTVTTAFPHNLAVGIPIRVSGTKSVTADGSYIINATPTETTFTYLSRANQDQTISIFDLYTSIITGEFFQGSQISISDAEGIITNEAGPVSTLTVKTPTKHGFGLNTPFYFLNLNSTISQEFESQNNASLSFDPSNSATAQTFDGSNTLLQTPIDLSNSATTSTFQSAITSTSPTAGTITVSISGEDWSILKLGSPLYYSVSVGGGYFQQNPRGVVFIKNVEGVDQPGGAATFQVSQSPDGPALPILANMTGFFQIANQARTFAGNNVDPETQIDFEVEAGPQFLIDGGNQGYDGAPESPPSNTSTVVGYTGTTMTVFTAEGSLDYYQGAMLRYSTTGDVAAGLVQNATYFVTSFTQGASGGLFNMSISEFPGESPISVSGGSGTQTFSKIGVSLGKNIFHIRGAGFEEKDLLEYSFPENGPISTSENKGYYFVAKVWDVHNFSLSPSSFVPISATGGTVTDFIVDGELRRVHAFTATASSSFTVEDLGTGDSEMSVLVVAGGAAGTGRHGAGGGAGGLVFVPNFPAVSGQTYNTTVGAGGTGETDVNYHGEIISQGKNSVFGPITALGGGRGGNQQNGGARGHSGRDGGSGGGGNWVTGTFGNGIQPQQSGLSGAPYGFGNRGGANVGGDFGYGGGGGGGAGGIGTNGTNRVGGEGGDGLRSAIIFGKEYVFSKIFSSNYGESGYFAGGGGGGVWSNFVSTGPGRGGKGGGGQGAYASTTTENANGRAGKPNTGGGGGGAGGTNQNHVGGPGGSGIILVSYPLTTKQAIFPSATGGAESTFTDPYGVTWKTHTFTNTGSNTFTVTNPGTFDFEFLLVAGGGGGGRHHGGGGGGGGFIETKSSLQAQAYTINVGAGGQGQLGTNSTPGGNAGIGGNTTAFGFTAIGGGGGGNYTANGAQGGSAGGAQNWAQVNGPQVPIDPSQGHSGGDSLSTAQDIGGGGGGAGAPGSSTISKHGGRGRVSYITGSKVFYGGGGAAANYARVPVLRFPNHPGGGGRSGIGLHNNPPQVNQPGEAGTNGLGGGGGGAASHFAPGGNGGSGIATVRYPIALAPKFPGFPGGLDDSLAMQASGGNLVYNIYQDEKWYRVHAFTSTGNSTFSVSSTGSLFPAQVEYLIVAGGGGGGAHCGGGGGAGGVLQGVVTVSSQNYPIAVGAGAARRFTTDVQGFNGANSTALGLTAIGGGGGGTIAQGGIGNGIAGGSGGGAGGWSSGSGTNFGGAGQAGQGNRGGNAGPRFSNNNVSGAGGGGAGEAAADRVNSFDAIKLNGGIGISTSIMGYTYWFGGGGGSGTYQFVDAGDGGRGGGGGGSSARSFRGVGDQIFTFRESDTLDGTEGTGTNAFPGDGVPNSGGGGGGGNGEGSSAAASGGGSGIVVIRYRIG